MRPSDAEFTLLFYGFGAALILGFLLSLILLVAYRRALRRLMKQRAPGTPAGALEFPSPTPSALPPNLFPLARARRTRTALVYALAGAACSAALTMTLLGEAGAVRLLLFLTFWFFNLWPVLLTLNLIFRWRPRTRLLYVALYFLACATISAVDLARSPKSSAGQLILAFILTNAPATIVFGAIALKGVRQIGPTLLPFCVVVTAGSLSILHLATVDASIAHLTTAPIFFLVMELSILALVGWFAARLIVALYNRRLISDQSLLIDSLWLFFVSVQAVLLLFRTGGETGSGSIWMVLAFPIYLLGANLGLRLVGSRPSGPYRPDAPPVSLLVLRAFALQGKAARIFKPVTAFWRYVGPVRLISGPDLASTTVQPDSFLEFVSGRMSRLFIHSAEALDARLTSLPNTADPDGRFRVSDFFCHDNTWQPAVTRLLHLSDIVLADFRGLGTGSRAGCEWEIRQIAAVGLAKCVFLLDSAEDETRLHSILGASAAVPRLLYGTRDSHRDLAAILAELSTSPVAAARREQLVSPAHGPLERRG